MFRLETFIEDCRSAVARDPSHVAVAEVVERAMDRPEQVIAELGEPVTSGIFPLYRGPDLTIINVLWKDGMTVSPHNHDMWGVIGVYGGREDNIFWRRIKDDPDGRIEAAGARSIGTGEVCKMGRDIIHSVTNPLSRLTGAIQIYGGDFFAAHQSEWDAEHLKEHARDMEAVRARFEMD